MDKLYRVTEEVPPGVPRKAICRRCPTVYSVSTQIDDAIGASRYFDEEFAKHSKEKHGREDASQAAARIVPEATDRG